jgi:hypothetical protein
MIENAKVVKISLHCANVFSKYAIFFSTTPPEPNEATYQSVYCCNVKFFSDYTDFDGLRGGRGGIAYAALKAQVHSAHRNAVG